MKFRPYMLLLPGILFLSGCDYLEHQLYNITVVKKNRDAYPADLSFIANELQGVAPCAVSKFKNVSEAEVCEQTIQRLQQMDVGGLSKEAKFIRMEFIDIFSTKASLMKKILPAIENHDKFQKSSGVEAFFRGIGAFDDALHIEKWTQDYDANEKREKALNSKFEEFIDRYTYR